MNKQIKTAEGVAELDMDLVKLLEANSYNIEFVKSKPGSKDNKSEESHYCINTLDIEENELGAEDVLDDSEVLALYLQQNDYGNIKQAVKEFAERLKREFIEGDGDDEFTEGWNGACSSHRDKIDDLIKEIYGE